MDLSNSNKAEVKKEESPSGAARIQIVCPLSRLPENLAPLISRKDVQCAWIPSYESAEKHPLLEQSDLTIFFPGKITQIDQKRKLGRLLFLAPQKNIPVLLLTDDPTLTNLIPPSNDQVLMRIQTAKPDVGPDELWGRICALLDFSPLFTRIEQYTGRLEKWTVTLNNRFEELHQELRLAWRVQQDFLPKRMPKTSRLRFGTLYRPASWVSGDIYEIVRLDENHIGFSIADVVGHGVAAGLMTLFVKRALVTREHAATGYRLLTPDQALGRLNDELCGLELPEHQFVTGCYGIINLQTLELSLARAGHPHPVLIDPQGGIQTIKVDGSLLGVFPGTVFPQKRLILPPRSKLVLFTDGLEQAFGVDGGETKMREELVKISHLPAEQMVAALAAELDLQEYSLHPTDDITALVIETLP